MFRCSAQAEVESKAICTESICTIQSPFQWSRKQFHKNNLKYIEMKFDIWNVDYLERNQFWPC